MNNEQTDETTENEPVDETEVNKSQEVRTEIQDLRSDILDVKETFQNERHNTKNKLRYVIGKHSRKIGLVLIGLVISYFIFWRDSFTIPDWVIVAFAGTIAGCIIGYIPAKRLAERFVTDSRVPILEFNAENFDTQNSNKMKNVVGVYAVPQEKIPNMEVYEGEAFDMKTKEMGEGYQVEKFTHIRQNGNEHIIAKGTWMGEKSSMELAKDVGAIEGMRQNLKPKAQKGFAYELMWPSIMQELQSSVANMITRQIEGVTVFKGTELRSEIDDIKDKYGPDNIGEQIANEESLENADSIDDLENAEEIGVSEDNEMLEMLNDN